MLRIRFRDGSELLESYLPNFSQGGFFVPTRRSLAVGHPVVVDVRMPALGDSLLIGGDVAWSRRGRRSESIRAGLGVRFAETERKKRDYLLALARGNERHIKTRRHKRLPIQIPAYWRMPRQSDRHVAMLGEIGSGGALLRTDAQLPPGAAVVVELTAPGSTMVQAIEGRVAWRRGTPGDEGVGIEFRCRDMAGKRRLRELIRRLGSDTA